MLQLLSELKQVHRSDMATRSSDTGRVIDITWPAADAPGGKPTVDVRQLPASDYAPEPTSEALVEKHRRVLLNIDM